MKKILIILTALLLLCLLVVSANAIFVQYDTKDFGLKVDTQSHWENTAPTITGEQPTNGSIGEPLQRIVGCTIEDGNLNHTLNVTFATNVSGSWINKQTNESILPDGVVNWTYMEANTESTHYFWRVYVYDGFDNTTWTFDYTTIANATSLTLYDTLSFGLKANVTTNQAVTISNPNPSNGSTGVDVATINWSALFTDSEGDTFNWSIETAPDVGNSNATDDTTGVKNVTFSSLSYEITYTVFVNASDSVNGTAINHTYTFTTQPVAVLVIDSTLSFGLKVQVFGQEPMITLLAPSNESTELDMYPLLNISVEDYQGDNFNITWSTNATDTWLQYNSTVTNGTFRRRALFANESNTKYWWTVQVNDSEGHWTNKTYTFTTRPYTWGNWSDWWIFYYNGSLPILSNEAPSNGSSGLNPGTQILSITVNDPDGENMNISFYNADTWVLLGENNTVGNGTYNQTINTEYNNEYNWSVNCTDGVNWVNEIYNFSTVIGGYPIVSGLSTVDGSTGVLSSLSNLSVTIEDPDGDSFNWSIELSNGNNSNANDENNGTKTCDVNISCGVIDYIWWVNATDGTYTINESYTFTSEACFPNVTTNSSTSIGLTNATLNGYLNDSGGEACNVSFEYGYTDSYGNTTYVINSTDNASHVLRPTAGEIDEEIPNGDVDYLTVGALACYISFDTVTSPFMTNCEVDEVEVYVNGTKRCLSNTYIKPSIRIDGTWYQGNSFQITNLGIFPYGEYTGGSSIWTMNPSTGEKWTIGDINDAYFGAYFYGSICSCRFSTAWVTLRNTTAFVLSGDVFNTSLTSLSPGTTYHYRAVANNSNGTDYGGDMNFTTLPGAVTVFSASNYDSDSINISWSKSTGQDSLYIVYKKDGFPSDRYDGTFLVNTSNSAYNHTSLGLGTSYYYRAWSYNSASGFGDYADAIGYTNPGCPTSLQENNRGLNSISLIWNQGTNATRTVVFRNSSGVPNYPNMTNGIEVINTTSSSGTASGLSSNTTYWFSAYAFNPVSSLWSECNSTDDASTLDEAGNITSFTIVSLNDTRLNLIWTKANVDDYTVIVRKTGSYPSDPFDGTEMYNSSELSTVDTYLIPMTRYYYCAWAWNGEAMGSEKTCNYNYTLPEPPQNFTGIVSGSDLVVTWDKGTGASRTVIRNDSSSYPDLDTGNLIYNNTGETTTLPGVSTIDYIRGWSYRLYDGIHFYSESVDLLWGGLEINAYEHENTSADITNYTVFLTDQSGSQTYQRTNCNNPTYIDVNDVPSGEKIAIQVSKEYYNTMIQYHDLYANQFYEIDFYLPYSEDNPEGGGDIPDIPQLYSYINSKPVTDPTVDQTIDIDYEIESIIAVSKYTVSSDTREYHETTKSVVDHTTYEIVTLGFTATEMVEVSVYNTSISYWVPISSDNYTANSTHVNVSADVLDVNSSIIKAGYYGEGNVFYEWVFISETDYSLTDTTCVINHSVIDNDTIMVRINYYYYGAPPIAQYGLLYVIYVKDYYGDPIQDAKIFFKKYINETESFETVSSLYTDANGQVNLYLVPGTFYKVSIIKEYYQTEYSDFTPDPQDRARTFRMEEQEIETDRGEDVYYGITWTIDPDSHYQRGNFTVYFNITSSNNALDWFRMTVSVYNSSSGEWDQIYTETKTTASGGSISYAIEDVNISNITGKYKVSCWYKKDGFDPHEVIQTGSSIFYLEWGGLLGLAVWDTIPDWVYLLVVVIIMALVMAFILPVAGVGTGYIGIIILALALVLKPDLTTASGVSGWAILFITAFVYTIALFIWSKI